MNLLEKIKRLRELRKEQTWEKWWFVQGGAIYFQYKHRMWSRLRDSANFLPQLAWDQNEPFRRGTDELCDALEKAIRLIKHAADCGCLNPKPCNCLFGSEERTLLKELGIE